MIWKPCRTGAGVSSRRKQNVQRNSIQLFVNNFLAQVEKSHKKIKKGGS